MTKMAKLMKMFKVLLVNLTISSLLQTFFVPGLMAAEERTRSSGRDKITSALQISNGVLDMYGKYNQQKYQMINSQYTSAANTQLKQRLSPSCQTVKPPMNTPSLCYATPAKMFPECILPPSLSDMPTNVCMGPSIDPNEVSRILTYEDIAQSWMNHYDQMSNEASNATYPTGLRCLDQKKKAMDSAMTEMMNSIQRLQDKLNQDKQIFRENNKKILDDLDVTYGELFGEGEAKKNMKLKTLDLSKTFSPECMAIIGKENAKTGLNNIVQNMNSTNRAAVDFNANKSIIETDIRNEVNQITQTISNNGLGSFLGNQGNYIPQNLENAKNFKAINTQTAKQMSEFKASQDRLTKILKDVDYPIPPMDKDFSANISKFQTGADTFFKQKYVSSCIRNSSPDRKDNRLIEELIAGLKQRGTGGVTTATSAYQEQIRILFIEDTLTPIDIKMQNLKNLEKKFQGITVETHDNSSNRVFETPYSFLQKQVDRCQQLLVQDNTFSTSAKDPGGISPKEKIDRAKTALQELKNLNESFASKLGQGILNQALNCGGATPKAGSCTGEKALDTSSENFCIAHASACSDQIRSCYGAVEQVTETKKNKLKTTAEAFNANVKNMMAKSQIDFNNQRINAERMVKDIQARFPGTNFELPKDMFVAITPEMKLDAYGIPLAENGDMKEILDGANSYTSKLEKLKEMFKTQKASVNKEIGDYINGQKTAMEKQHQRWSDLYEKCGKAYSASTDAINKTNQEATDRQNKENEMVSKFCETYHGIGIQSNPVAACKQGKDLGEDMGKILGRLKHDAVEFAKEFKAVCDGFMQEAEEDDKYDITKCEIKNGDTQTEKQNYKDCRANVERALAKAGKKASPTIGQIPLSAVCPTGANEAEFIAAAAKKMSAADRDLFKEKTTLNDAKDIVVSNTFFADIKELIGDASNPCTKLKEIDENNNQKKNRETEDKITEQENNKKKAEEDLGKLKSAVDNAKTPVKIIAANGQITETPNTEKIEAAQKAYSEGLDKKTAAVNAADKLITDLKRDSEDAKAKSEKLKKYLTDLNPTAPSSIEKSMNEVRNIGEQMTGPCDMQQNTNSQKMKMPWEEDLQAHDRAVLGI